MPSQHTLYYLGVIFRFTKASFLKRVGKFLIECEKFRSKVVISCRHFLYVFMQRYSSILFYSFKILFKVVSNVTFIFTSTPF